MARIHARYGQPGVYNAGTLTLNDGDSAGLQLDVNGKLLVSGISGGGGGTQYAEAATTTPATGTLELGRYNVTRPTLADGGMYGVQVDSRGSQYANLDTRLDATNDAVTSVPFGHSFANITTNTTTTVKSGSGFLSGIIINNPSAITVASLTLTIYDNTAGSGTKVGTLIVPVDTTAKPFKITYTAAFTTGLTIVTAGPTVAADLTVEYR